MDLEIIILSEVSQWQIYEITYLWNQKMIQMILFTKQKQTHRLIEWIKGKKSLNSLGNLHG